MRLFGELDLRRNGQQLTTVESARARSLLAYLLVHGPAPLPRERLAFLLWPDSTEGQARTNLRHLLHTLRRASPEVDEYLEITSQMLRWRTEQPCWIDVAAFEAAAAHAEDGSEAELDSLREALDLYAGDLLEGSYDEWLVEERERLRDRYLSVLERAAALLAGSGRHAEALRLARDLLRHDPLREDTHRLLMRLFDAVGDRAAAVRVYHECVATLRRELGVAPSSATRAEYDVVMRTEAHATTPHPPQSTVLPLVGRDLELQVLTDRWKDAEGGRARLLLVSGEPGVGKTRLVEELAGWCAHRGAVVATARSYPDEGELGYGVLISWLRSSDIAARLHRLASEATELGRLLPELVHESAGLVPAAPDPDPAAQQRRLFEAASRALVGSGRPTLLITDDAQWCDEHSLRFIHHLVRGNPGKPLLVVGTVRREDLDEAHTLDVVTGGLRAIDCASEVVLGRLQQADTEKLARSVAGRDLDETTLHALCEETEGNPLFVVETVRAGSDRVGTDRSPVTPKVHAVIGARLRQLSDGARRLASVAATIGRAFTADVVREAAGLDDDLLIRSLDELWRRGVVREQGVDSYDFTHGRIRDVAYDAQGPAHRRRNHLLIAQALLRLHARDPDAVSGEIARHFDRGGRPEEAVAWYRRAAIQSQRLHADVEAVRLLGRARVLVDALPDGEQRRALELDVLSALPTPVANAEGFASPRLAEIQERLLVLSRLVGVEPDPTLLRSLVMSNLCRRDFAGARSAATQLRRVAERSGDDLLLVETEYLLGIGAFWHGAFAAAREHFELVGVLSDLRRRPEHLVRFGHDPAVVSLSRLANTLWFLGCPEEAAQTRDAAIAMAVEVGQPFSRGVALVFAALLSLDLDDPVPCREYVAAMSDLAELGAFRSALGAFRGYVEVLDGRPAPGLAAIRATIDANPQDHAPGQRSTYARLLLAAYECTGDHTGGLRAADDVLGLTDDSRIWEAEVRRLRAVFLANLGAAPMQVEQELGRAAEVARRQGAVGLTGRIERTRVELAGRR